MGCRLWVAGLTYNLKPKTINHKKLNYNQQLKNKKDYENTVLSLPYMRQCSNEIR